MADDSSNSRELVRVATVQQEVLRRLATLESRHIDEFPGAIDKIRDVTKEQLQDRLSSVEKQVTEAKKLQTRILWVLMLAVAGQALRLIGPGILSDLLK